ncbi:hypothetical protein [Lewinella sp. W8]|uniref:hypothetical protein n=1 Tax=Lewinella sp. W8 TaxID=2528208 RepID=UPI001067AEE6|nr:hypothetical protein [Lewinella sp. W8]MTB49690.1 hypothetical protein [Lewinella sp. W8]
MSCSTSTLTFFLVLSLLACAHPALAQDPLLSRQENLVFQQIQQSIRITQSQQRMAAIQAMGKNQGDPDLSEELKLIAESAYRVPPNRYAKAYGSPFLLPEHTQGTFYDLLKNQYELDSVNFNAYTGEFEFLTPNGTFAVVRGAFNRVELKVSAEQTRIFYFDINQAHAQAYVEEIYHGNRVFGATYHVVNKHTSRTNMLTGDADVEENLKGIARHYLTLDGETQPTPKSGKKLGKISGVPAINDFINRENLDLRNLENLKRIYAELDRLLAE